MDKKSQEPVLGPHIHVKMRGISLKLKFVKYEF